jgi:hypothetical protein
MSSSVDSGQNPILSTFSASNSNLNDIQGNQYNIGVINLTPGPSPCLSSAFAWARDFESMVGAVQASRQQVSALASSVDTILRILDAEYLAQRLQASQTSTALDNLNQYVIDTIRDRKAPLIEANSLLKEFVGFTQKLTTDDFLKHLTMQDQRIAQIEDYYRRIDETVASFKVC